MKNVPLHELIALHRGTILQRCQARVAARSIPGTAGATLNPGVRELLNQVCEVLCSGDSSSRVAISWSAALHSRERLLQGCTVSQLVHDYGDVCQAVTALAIDLDLTVSARDFQILHRCIDDAVAAGVSEFGRAENQTTLDSALALGRERIGLLTHELRNRTTAAMLAFQALKAGCENLPVTSGVLLERSLASIRDLISDPLADVSVDDNSSAREVVRVALLSLRRSQVVSAAETRRGRTRPSRRSRRPKRAPVPPSRG